MIHYRVSLPKQLVRQDFSRVDRSEPVFDPDHGSEDKKISKQPAARIILITPPFKVAATH